MNETQPLPHPAAGEGSLPAPAPNPPVSTPSLHPRIETYLDRVCAPLARRLPEERRRELRAELRLHLEALVEAHCELGSDPDAAVTEALAQFGDARQLVRAWRRSSPAPLAAGEAAAAGTVFLMCTCASSLWLVTAALQSGASPLAVLLASPVLPVFGGFLVSMANRKHPLSGWGGLLLLGLLSFGSTALLPSLFQFTWLGFATAQLMMGLIAACGAAGMGTVVSRWKEQQSGRRIGAGVEIPV